MSAHHWIAGPAILLALAGSCAMASAEENPRAAMVTTLSAEALGLTGMSVNGSIHPRGAETKYYFEYGPTPSYGWQTPTMTLGPRLAAYYHESWDEGLGGWESWCTKTHFTTGGASAGFVRFAEPSRDDHNHDDGIGTVHLTKYLYSGPLPHVPSVYLGGGDPDLRDARISIRVRGNDWKPSGSELVWWTQSQSNIERLNDGWSRANWAYTGFSLTHLLLDGKWHHAQYALRNDASQWTYGGGSGGYEYWPIDGAQRHLNNDFFHMLVFVDVNHPPTGSIDFDELTITYRNHSLLAESNGGKLVSAPPSPDNPARLTDGWRHGKDRMWRSAKIKTPSEPLEFVYRFDHPVKIHTIQLHQNPEWPSKEVEVLVSEDGQQFAPLVERTLPEQGQPNANWAFTVDRGLSAGARWLKVRVLSGYRRAHWGLGEIEVFGTGAVMLPDDDVYHVTTDVHELRPGTTYHYRLVAVSASGVQPGEDREFTTPATRRPLCETVQASRVAATSAKISGRLNPLGEPTTFYFEYGPDANYGAQTPTSAGGKQITPRTVVAELTGLKPATTYHCRLVARNSVGTSYGADRSFQTAAE